MLRNFRRYRLHRRRPSAIPAAEVQALEPRSLPTGTVVLTFASNVAKITGDNLDNDVTVNVTAAGITVTGNNGTKIKLGSTLHNADEAVALPTPNPQNAAVGLDIKLAGGNDTLAFNVDGALGSRSLTKLSVDTGDGDDSVTVSIGTGTTLSFSDAVNISTGKGLDHLLTTIDGSVAAAKAMTMNTGADQGEATLVVNGSLTVNAATTFNMGDGNDVLTMRGDGAVNFNGPLNVNTAKGNDEVAIKFSHGMTVKGLASLTTSDGNDQILLTHAQSTLDFQGGLTMDAGTGNDEVSISGSEGTLHVAGKDLTIKSGVGDDSITLDEKLAIDTNLNITTDKGADLVTLVTGTGITDSLFPITNTILGDVSIDTGDDHDQVNVQVGSATWLTIASAGKTGLKILTGKGDDDILLLHANAAVGSSKGVTIDAGAGAGHVMVVGGQLNVTGALKVTTGELDSTVSISDTLSVSGDVGITTGNGNDTVSLAFGEGAAGTGAVNTVGSLTIQTGNGADDVAINNTGSVEVVSNVALKSTGIASINTGSGADKVELVASANVTVDKDLAINTGAGADAVHIEAVSGSIAVGGSETVNLSDDDDCFVQGTATAINAFRTSQITAASVTFQVDTNLSVMGGTGNDFIGLAGVKVGKAPAAPGAALPASLTTIDAGTGNDTIGISAVTLRDLKLLAGTGDDTIDANNVTIQGTTNTDLGTGDDRLAIRGSTSMNDNATLLGGAGVDQLAVGANVTVATGKKIKLDGGANGMIGMDSSSSFNGALNPAPVNITDGTVNSQAITDAVASLFQNCLAQF